MALDYEWEIEVSAADDQMGKIKEHVKEALTTRGIELTDAGALNTGSEVPVNEVAGKKVELHVLDVIREYLKQNGITDYGIVFSLNSSAANSGNRIKYKGTGRDAD